MRKVPPAALISGLLPTVVAAEEAFADSPDVVLFPEEEAVVAQALEVRRREFATVRLCARTAMGRLGLPAAPLVPGQGREPCWPAGVVGSMTHCAGYRAAVVGWSSDVHSIGIDAEPHEPLPVGVLDLISLPEERAQLRELGGGLHWGRILFCAKESVYKAWFPLARSWLGFCDARITFDPAGAFSASLLVERPEVGRGRLTAFTGRWAVSRGLVLAAIVHLP